MSKKLITDAYRDLNDRLHSDNPEYGAMGHLWAPRIIAELKRGVGTPLGYGSYLDYGCGKGQLLHAIDTELTDMFDLYAYDPVTFPTRPPKCDLVTCMDVMEHVEPELVDNVLDDISKLTRRKAIFCIALYESKDILPDGRNAHICLRKKAWWLRELKSHFKAVSVRPPLRPGSIRHAVFSASNDE